MGPSEDARLECAPSPGAANREAKDQDVERVGAMGDLAGRVAHDFNNLLGLILSYTTLVARRVTDPIAREDLEEIRMAAERGVGLTNELLAFARPSATSLEGFVLAEGDLPPAEDVGVVIVDDHVMFAQSLARLLADEPGVTVLGSAATGVDGLELVTRLRPAVVLVDYQLPDRNGTEVAASIKHSDPDVVVVMLTGAADDELLLAAIEAGCSGFITKDRAASDVASAVRAAAAGEALISPAQLTRVLARLSPAPKQTATELTDREVELIERMARGGTNKAIASDLHLSVNTVRNYVQAVLNKLGAHSKLEAVAVAVRTGVIDYPGEA